VEEFEKFARQVTIPALKKIPGCLDAYFLRVHESRKPEYLWVVFWKDHGALEAARTNPAWREQAKKFEAGNFYKTIPLELVCEELASLGSAAEKARKAEKPRKEEEQEAPESPEPAHRGFVAPSAEGE
jgi:heme-degrading monooxygenase HmoA